MGLAMGTYGLAHRNEPVERVCPSIHISILDYGHTPPLSRCVREGETILTGNYAGPVQSRRSRTAVDCSVAAAHCTAVMVST